MSDPVLYLIVGAVAAYMVLRLILTVCLPDHHWAQNWLHSSGTGVSGGDGGDGGSGCGGGD